MSTILVTGGAGFIGSHLVERLLKKGNEVIVLDDLSTGIKGNIPSGITFHEDTVLDYPAVTYCVQKADKVFHLAASVGVENVLKNPTYCIKNNIQGTENVLKACKEHKKRVLITSTSEVYGKSPYQNQTETDDLVYGNPQNLRWSYAASKLIDELTALGMYHAGYLEVIVARLFNTIGTRQTGKYGMVVPRFIDAAKKGERLEVYGHGNQQRTFTSVHDVVWALDKLMEKDEAVGEVFNVGGVCTTTIISLAKNIIKLTGSDSMVGLVPYTFVFGEHFEDMQSRIPSIQKIKKLIGYNPERNLNKILMEIINV
jgi:UDP-glucose 4-epimerase